MPTSTVRVGMSLMIAVAFWVNPVQAQEKILLVPTVPYEPAYHAPTPLPFTARPQPMSAAHLPGRILHNHGMACGTDPLFPSCANWHYEWKFAFGSCRSFFGESCPPNQPCVRKARQP